MGLVFFLHIDFLMVLFFFIGVMLKVRLYLRCKIKRTEDHIGVSVLRRYNNVLLWSETIVASFLFIHFYSTFNSTD